jgi:hypothetical protein
MDRVGLRARGLSILGVFICVLMLTGVSCGGADAMAAVSKGVSTTYNVIGVLTCDEDDNGVWMDDSDHRMANWPVFYRIEGDETIYSTYTNALGYYSFSRGEDVYVDVWMIPATESPHWRTYYRDISGEADWDDPNPVVRVAANNNEFVNFVGSDHKE